MTDQLLINFPKALAALDWRNESASNNPYVPETRQHHEYVAEFEKLSFQYEMRSYKCPLQP